MSSNINKHTSGKYFQKLSITNKKNKSVVRILNNRSMFNHLQGKSVICKFRIDHSIEIDPKRSVEHIKFNNVGLVVQAHEFKRELKKKRKSYEGFKKPKV